MTMEIVGVIGDVRSSLSAPVRPTVYVPVGQAPEWTFTVAHGYFPVSWVVRTRDDRGAAVAQSLREIVRRVEPQLPLSSVETMEEVIASGLTASRSQMLLLGIFAGIALALAAAGLYGLVAYTVAQRAREIGIHMALGATAGVILRRVVARGLLLTLAGLVWGLAPPRSPAAGSRSFLVGVKALDPLTFVATSLFLIATATIASLAPARAGRAHQSDDDSAQRMNFARRASTREGWTSLVVVGFCENLTTMTRHHAEMAGRRMSWLQAGQGRPVVLLHAFPLGAEMWKPQLDAVPHGWMMIAPDLPGFGESRGGGAAGALSTIMPMRCWR